MNIKTKKIFILWFQGFDQAPMLIKKCLKSWISKNPSWDVIQLDDKNLKKYIDLDKVINNLGHKTISKASLSDIIRISLLHKYGGVWVDASAYCNRPLDEWLLEYSSSGFFAFNYENYEDKPKGRPVASWFLYAEKDNYLINKWYHKSIEYCNETKLIGTTKTGYLKSHWKAGIKEGHYFWFHYIFEDLLIEDKKFSELWQDNPKISEKLPHFIQKHGLLKKVTPLVQQHIDCKKSPLYKLTHKYDKDKFKPDCNLSYLINPKYKNMNIAGQEYKVKYCLKNLRFIHIGKCGGTAVITSFANQEIGLKQIHLKKVDNIAADDKFIIWIRNPLHRFVSAFNFSFDLINFDVKGINPDDLNINNCLAPMRLRKKIRQGYTFTTRYDELIRFFRTPNNLAESLSSTDNNLKTKAYELMDMKVEHISKGIGWYLNNGDFVEENLKKILYVGKLETLKYDIVNLGKILDIPLRFPKKIRENKSMNNKYLSKVAINNLLDYYQNTDYRALEVLAKNNFIDLNTLKAYKKY